MQRVVSSKMIDPVVLAGDCGQILQVIQSGSWKVSGSGLDQGAFSCALFMSQYAAAFGLGELTAQIQELFDCGCNGIVSGKTAWLNFADLALVANRLSQHGFIDIEQQHFFEDIDKLALAAIANPGRIAGFANSDLGAALYGLRRLNLGATHFSKSIQQFASALASGVHPAFADAGRCENENLRSGLSAPLLFVSAASELGWMDKKIAAGGVALLVDKVRDHVNVSGSSQIIPGFLTGDLGKGYALLRAGMSFQQGEWIAAGLKISLDCAYSILDQSIGSLDLASGATGISLAFDKLFRLSGHGIFRTAASQTQWLSLKAGVVIDDRDIDQGYSFYHGLAGIGLATLYWQHQPTQIEQLEELLWLI